MENNKVDRRVLPTLKRWLCAVIYYDVQSALCQRIKALGVAVVCSAALWMASEVVSMIRPAIVPLLNMEDQHKHIDEALTRATTVMQDQSRRMTDIEVQQRLAAERMSDQRERMNLIEQRVNELYRVELEHENHPSLPTYLLPPRVPQGDRHND